MLWRILRPLPNNSTVPARTPKILPDYSVVLPVATVKLQDWSDGSVLTGAEVNPILQTTGLQTIAYPTYNADTGLWEIYGVPNGTYKLLVVGARFQSVTIDPFVINAAVPAHAAQDVMQKTYSNNTFYFYSDGGGSSPQVVSAYLYHPYGGVAASGTCQGQNFVSWPPLVGGQYNLIVTAASGFDTLSTTFYVNADDQGPSFTMHAQGGEQM